MCIACGYAVEVLVVAGCVGRALGCVIRSVGGQTEFPSGVFEHLRIAQPIERGIDVERIIRACRITEEPTRRAESLDDVLSILGVPGGLDVQTGVVVTVLMVSAGTVPAIPAAAPSVVIGQDGTHVVALVIHLLNDGGAIGVVVVGPFRGSPWRWCGLEGFSQRRDSGGDSVFGIPFAPRGESRFQRLIKIIADAVGKHEQPTLAGPGVNAERQPGDRLVHGAVVELVGGDVAEIGGGDQRVAHGFELRGVAELGEGNMHIAPIALLVDLAPAPEILLVGGFHEERNAGHGLGVNIEHDTRGQVVGGRGSCEGDGAGKMLAQLLLGGSTSDIAVFGPWIGREHQTVALGIVLDHGLAQESSAG